MKKEDLIRAVGMIEDKFIIEADMVRASKNRKKLLLKISSIAAAFVLIFAIGFQSGFRFFPVKNLQQVKISREINSAGGTGEIYSVKNISEIISSDLPSEKIKKLPIFENSVVYDGNGSFFYFDNSDFNKMFDFLDEVVARLNLKESEYEYYKEAYEIGVTSEKVSVRVTRASNVIVEFNNPIELPKGYGIASYDELKETAEYLKEEFKDLIGMKNPVTHISGGEYDVDKNQIYTLSFYESASEKEEIINRNFNEVTVHFDENGAVTGMTISSMDLTKKLGEYPIISYREAEEILRMGNALTTLTEPINDESKVAKAELIYRNESTEEYFIPYYEFYVEMPQENNENGFKSYGVYYVPAIEGEYIKYR